MVDFIVKEKFDADEALLLKLQNKGVKLIDKNNFVFYQDRLSGKTVKAAANDKLTKYLLDKAVNFGAIEEKSTRSKKTSEDSE